MLRSILLLAALAVVVLSHTNQYNSYNRRYQGQRYNGKVMGNGAWVNIGGRGQKSNSRYQQTNYKRPQNIGNSGRIYGNGQWINRGYKGTTNNRFVKPIIKKKPVVKQVLPSLPIAPHAKPMNPHCQRMHSPNIQDVNVLQRYNQMCHMFLTYESARKTAPLFHFNDEQLQWFKAITTLQQASQPWQLTVQQIQQGLLATNAAQGGLLTGSNQGAAAAAAASLPPTTAAFNIQFQPNLQPSTGARPKVLRKEYRMMTDEERNRFHRALRIMKETMVGEFSQYDIIALNHAAQIAPGAHFGVGFYGFHREYVAT